ncbi:MAG: hypothetical protein PHF63_00115 [Herbinix sp.]|nr:hypothetical protein [Herbinix sp.]
MPFINADKETERKEIEAKNKLKSLNAPPPPPLIPMRFMGPTGQRFPTCNAEQLALLQEAITDLKGVPWFVRGPARFNIKKSDKDKYGIYHLIEITNSDDKKIGQIKRVKLSEMPLAEYYVMEEYYDLNGNIIRMVNSNEIYSDEDVEGYYASKGVTYPPIVLESKEIVYDFYKETL